MTQEALNNIRRHAGVRGGSLFNGNATDILLVIKDEGRGFVIDKRAKQIPSIGLQSIRDRANPLAVPQNG